MLSAGELLDEAKTSSGLNDYGDMGFAEGPVHFATRASQ